ncbi:hypothetical protein J1N35_045021, partial [Gossypium stocksii]
FNNYEIDRIWMKFSRVSNGYRNGVQTFLNFVFQNVSQENMIFCPCKKYGNINWHYCEVVYEHLIVDGFIRGIKNGFFMENVHVVEPLQRLIQSVREDDMEDMLRDAFNMRSHGLQSFSPDLVASNDCNFSENAFTKTRRSICDEQANDEAAKSYTLFNEMNEELYEGSKFSKMLCILLFHLKCLGGWTGNSLTMLLEFLRYMFHFTKISHSCKDMKKLIKNLGIGYNKIHSCPNDCMLYWGDRKNKQSCHVCSKSRWMNRNIEDFAIFFTNTKALKAFHVVKDSRIYDVTS